MKIKEGDLLREKGTEAVWRCIKLFDDNALFEDTESHNRMTVSHDCLEETFSLEKRGKSLKLEVGKFYKTYDGRKAFVFAYDGSEYKTPYRYVIVGVSELTYYCDSDGFCFCGKINNGFDIAEEWED